MQALSTPTISQMLRRKRDLTMNNPICINFVSQPTKDKVVEILHDFGYEIEQLEVIQAVASAVNKVLEEDELYLDRLEVVNKFRIAVLNKDSETILECGSLTWVDDVAYTNLDWARTTEANKVICDTLVSIAKSCENFVVAHNATATNNDSFARATYNKLESLAWKTYIQLVNSVYKTRGNK